MTITSRHNPLVARFRDAARGDADAVMLLDGAHLVADALAANVAIHVAAVTAAALESPAVHELAGRLSQRGVEIVPVSAPVMDAISPVRSAALCPMAVSACTTRMFSISTTAWAGEPLLW